MEACPAASGPGRMDLQRTQYWSLSEPMERPSIAVPWSACEIPVSLVFSKRRHCFPAMTSSVQTAVLR